MGDTTPEYESINAAATRRAISRRSLYRLIEDGLLQAWNVPGSKLTRVKRGEVDALFQPVT